MSFLKGVPLWVYVVFFYVVFVGIKALKSRVIAIHKLFIAPIIFIGIKLYELFQHDSVSQIGMWLLFLVIGSCLGWFLSKDMSIRVDKQKGMVKIPGSVGTLIIMILIFCIKFFFGYQLAINPELHNNTVFFLTHLSLSGIITGTLLGKPLVVYNKYR